VARKDGVIGLAMSDRLSNRERWALSRERARLRHVNRLEYDLKKLEKKRGDLEFSRHVKSYREVRAKIIELKEKIKFEREPHNSRTRRYYGSENSSEEDDASEDEEPNIGGAMDTESDSGSSEDDDVSEDEEPNTRSAMDTEGNVVASQTTADVSMLLDSKIKKEMELRAELVKAKKKLEEQHNPALRCMFKSAISKLELQLSELVSS